MELSDIRRSFSDMTDEELQEALLQIRNSRRNGGVQRPHKKAAKKAAKGGNGKKPEASIDSIMNLLSAKDIEKLLGNIGGKNG